MEKKKVNVKTVLISVCAVVIIALLAVIIVLLLRKKPDTPAAPAADSRGTVVTKDNLASVEAEMTEPVNDASYTVSQSFDWTFDTAGKSTDVYTANSKENSRTVYFDMVDENGETVYSSPYMPLGTELTEFTLDKALPAGDHTCVVTYHLVDDDNKEVSHVSLNVNVHVE